ncbi:leucine-rich repeat and fibronectin type III domain-containing protein 1-like protein [Bacillus rossius redtenbacheri]|uniref:leucine-rich repeat and fibronectin type III domain-containing protein 1-like protein n=1 Tax=Bacillus rossius redtenbacheri TaxID=93214 RepID=UPI002FDEB167
MRAHQAAWLLAAVLLTVRAQCPWQHDAPELQSACLCAYNLGQELSVQCDAVDVPSLLRALRRHAVGVPLDLLYVNNSSIAALPDDAFLGVRLRNVQLSGCRIRSIAPRAFTGQEESLRNLNLQENELSEVPVASLRSLANLSLLDLSRNRISRVPAEAFATLQGLSTLKLADNNLTLDASAFRGLERSLKNLNLKGTRQKQLPEAVRGLGAMAFLDLAQNGLRELPDSGLLAGLASLTALNLERNLIQAVADGAFRGVEDTLSSLSLLNNLLAEFPKGGVGRLKELRVLDIGFNLLTELPEDAFSGNPSLTLLALDGNPLATVPARALAHLNTSLRGLSLGGRSLQCDCRLRWVAEWIRDKDLQVTSRERNPQFCGSPAAMRDRGFYSIVPEELRCDWETTTTTVTPSTSEMTTALSTPSTTTASTTSRPAPGPGWRATSTTRTPVYVTRPHYHSPSRATTTTSTTTTTTTTTRPTTTTTRPTTTTTRPTTTTTRPTTKPRLVVRPSAAPTPVWTRPRVARKEVVVRSAYRQDNSVIIQWDSETTNILGFRVVYRLFGDKSFKQGPPLEASEREFKIKNVPTQECMVVCVVSLEDVNVTPETVAWAQCREVRTVALPTSNMDKITIAASAAICGTVVVAVVIFVAASRRRGRKLHTLRPGDKGGLAVSGLPVNCCTGASHTPSPGGPLSSLATLSAFTAHKDWDQVSTYSNRSIPRPHVYHVERTGSLNAGCLPEERAHVTHFSGKGVKARSIADGQSQHSFSNHSGRYLAGSAFPSGLASSRPDLRQSRQSLAAASEHLSRTSFPAGATHHHQSASSRRPRPRSRSRDHQRPSSRYSTAGSTHTLNNYCDTSDNWTDHDMDIYMARNPTARGGLVPL